MEIKQRKQTMLSDGLPSPPDLGSVDAVQYVPWHVSGRLVFPTFATWLAPLMITHQRASPSVALVTKGRIIGESVALNQVRIVKTV